MIPPRKNKISSSLLSSDTFAHVLKQAGDKTDHIGKWHIWGNVAGGHFEPKANFIPPGPYRMGFDGFWAAYNFGHRNFEYSYWTDSAEEIKVVGEFKATHFTMGRTLEFTDRPDVDTLVGTLNQTGSGLRDLVLRITQREAFLTK